MGEGRPHPADAGPLDRAIPIERGLTDGHSSRRRIDEFALITLDRPEALNALNFELLRELAPRSTRSATGDARALLVTGAGDRAFCAGADIKELMGRSLTAAARGRRLRPGDLSPSSTRCRCRRSR